MSLRESDIDHKDKQNFNAVLHIIRASPLFQQIPDAKATQQYVDIIECVVQCLCTYLSLYNLTQEKTVKKPTVSPFLEIKIGSKKSSFTCKTYSYIMAVPGRRTCFVRSIVSCQG